MDARAIELPCELGLRDEELGELAKAIDIVDFKVGCLDLEWKEESSSQPIWAGKRRS